MSRKKRIYNFFKMTNEVMEAYNIPEHSTQPFCESLDRIIKASSITQQELGRALKVSGTTVMNYVKAYKSNPTIEFMRRIADFFDIKPSYFREYRLKLLWRRLEMFPDLIDIFLDLASNPRKLINDYDNWAKDTAWDRDKSMAIKIKEMEVFDDEKRVS